MPSPTTKTASQVCYEDLCLDASLWAKGVIAHLPMGAMKAAVLAIKAGEGDFEVRVHMRGETRPPAVSMLLVGTGGEMLLHSFDPETM